MAANLRKDIPRLIEFEVAQTGRAQREMNAQVSLVTLYLLLFLSLYLYLFIPFISLFTPVVRSPS